MITIKNESTEQMIVRKETRPLTGMAGVFNIRNANAWVRNFSLVDHLKKIYEGLQEMSTWTCVMINTKKALIGTCPWNFTDSGNLCDFAQVKQNMTVNYILQFLYTLKSQMESVQSNSILHVIGFNDKATLIEDLTKVASNQFNDSYIRVKRNLQYETFKKNGNSCDISKGLSKAYNILNEQFLNIRQPQCKKFLRILLFSGSPDSPTDAENVSKVLKTFTSSKNDFQGVVVNFFFLEDDYYFNKVTKSNIELSQYSDFREEDDSLIKSMKKINFALNVCVMEEQDFAILANQILKSARDAFIPVDRGYLYEFAKKFDSKMKTFMDLFEAINHHYSVLTKNTTRTKQKESIKGKINDEVSQKKIIPQVVDSIKTFFANEMKQGMKSFLESNEATFKRYRSQLETLENNLKLKGLLCNYWNEKMLFIKSQLELIENSLNQFQNLDNLLDYLGGNLNETVKALISSK